jgi:quercetin 2,3-dioxygenase
MHLRTLPTAHPQGSENGIRFLRVSGQALQEPVAWYDLIVMNTQAELRNAFDELERGTFLKHDQQP